MFSITKIIICVLIAIFVIFSIIYFLKAGNLDRYCIWTTVFVIALTLITTGTQALIEKENLKTENFIEQVNKTDSIVKEYSQKIYLPQENNVPVIEKSGNTYYFYVDSELNFKGEYEALPYTSGTNVHVIFEASDKECIKTKVVNNVKSYKYTFNKEPWYFSKNDCEKLKDIKNKPDHPIDGPVYGSLNYKNPDIVDRTVTKETTYITFCVPENTKIKYKDENGVILYKNISDFNQRQN